MENKHHNHIDSLYMRVSLLDKKVMAIEEPSPIAITFLSSKLSRM